VVIFFATTDDDENYCKVLLSQVLLKNT